MFDPTYPQDLMPIDATPMRNQLNSLQGLIDAIATVTSAVVDGETMRQGGVEGIASCLMVGRVFGRDGWRGVGTAFDSGALFVMVPAFS